MCCLGNADGTFQSPKLSREDAGLSAAVAGDFNGDGHLDVATSSHSYDQYSNVHSGTLTLLLGKGDGTFDDRTFARMADELAVGDFNNDGRPDLTLGLSAVGSNAITVMQGNGDGGFQGDSRTVTGNAPVSPVTGDFNNDGRLDIATVNPGSDNLSLLLGNGDGTFQPDRLIPLNPSVYEYTLVTGDFNGDGRPDLVTNGTILLGNGNGTFQTRYFTTTGTVLVAGDFNGDGKLDLVSLGQTSLGLVQGKGDGTFFPERQIAVESADDDNRRWGLGPDYFDPRNALIAGDFNNDSRLDLVIATPSTPGMAVLLGKGDGTFQPQRQVALYQDRFTGDWFSPSLLVPGDFDNDGRLDLFYLGVIWNEGDGNFADFEGPERPDYGAHAIAADFNGDGSIDLATSSYFGISGVLLGQQHGFDVRQDPIPFPGTFPPKAMVAGDFNGDHRLDLASADLRTNSVVVLLGKGDGSFGDPGVLSVGIQASPLMADGNGDGVNDVLTIDANGQILYRQGRPQEPGAFDPPVVVNPGLPARDVSYVGHTRLGPVLASVDAQGNTVSLYAFQNGGFVRVGSLATGPLPAQIVAADVNGDGWDDLVVRNAGDGSLSIFSNNALGNVQAGTSPFQAPLNLPVGMGISDLAAVDTTGSGSSTS